MDAISPVVADAYRLLQADLYGHLDEVEFLALKVDEWSDEDVAAARNLIPDLVHVIRGVLREHQPRGHDCPTCAGPWPCPVIGTIHRLVKDPQLRFVALARQQGPSE